MKKAFRLFISIVILVSFQHNVEATEHTFIDIKKIPSSNIEKFFIYEDQLIITRRSNSSQTVTVSSYDKTGTLNWEKFGKGPGAYAIAENKFVTTNNNMGLMYIHSTATGEILKTVKDSVPGHLPKIYINEKYIVLSHISPSHSYSGDFKVYDTNGNYVMKGKADSFEGGALFKDTFLYQDSKGVHSLNLSTRKKMWTVPLKAEWNNDHTLIPVDNVIFPRGFESIDNKDSEVVKEIMLAVDVRDGTVLEKIDFGKYEDFISTKFKEFGFLVNYSAEDIFHFYHFDGTFKRTLSMESPAIKQLKKINHIDGSHYNSNTDIIGSQEGLYYFKSYENASTNYIFSFIKSLDKKGNVKFEKVLDGNVHAIATTDSDKLFVAREIEKGDSGKSYELNVFDSNGNLSDVIETERLEYLKSDGSNIYGYSDYGFYIFKESESIKDDRAPEAPIVDSLDSTNHILTGKAETGSKVYAYAGNKLIGEATAVWGAFSSRIWKQAGGTKIDVYAVDKSGNKSNKKTIEVIDKTPPPAPIIDTIGDNSVAVTGKVESGAKVYAYVGGKKLGETSAKNGKYSMKITKQKAGITITAYAIDPAKNKSGSKKAKVIDKTAPAAPTVNKVTSKSTSASGKAEKAGTVLIYHNSKKIASGTVDSKGNFKVKIKAQKKGTSLKFHVQDKAGNKSNSKTLKVN